MEDIGNYGYTLFRTIPSPGDFQFSNGNVLVPGGFFNFRTETG